MKKKQLVELHTKSISQLRDLVKKTQQGLMKLRTDFGAGKLKDVHQIKFKSRDLARIKTILREKELLKPNEKLQSQKRKEGHSEGISRSEQSAK